MIKLNFSKDILQIKDIENVVKPLHDFIRKQVFEIML